MKNTLLESVRPSDDSRSGIWWLGPSHWEESDVFSSNSKIFMISEVYVFSTETSCRDPSNLIVGHHWQNRSRLAGTLTSLGTIPFLFGTGKGVWDLLPQSETAWSLIPCGVLPIHCFPIPDCQLLETLRGPPRKVEKIENPIRKTVYYKQ